MLWTYLYDLQAAAKDLEKDSSDEPYDVVDAHQQWNRAPKAPNPGQLNTIQKEMKHSKDSDSSTDNGSESDDKPRTKRHSHMPYSVGSDDPKKLGFYPPQWRDILENAKVSTCVWMATECVFPHLKNESHREKAESFIKEALSKHQEDGGQVEDGNTGDKAC